MLLQVSFFVFVRGQRLIAFGLYQVRWESHSQMGKSAKTPLPHSHLVLLLIHILFMGFCPTKSYLFF